MPYELWRHIASGRRYLVVSRAGAATVAAGPLLRGQDPVVVLETHGPGDHDPTALLDMRRRPDAYAREYAQDAESGVAPRAGADLTPPPAAGDVTP